jgi:O-antigen ligase
MENVLPFITIPPLLVFLWNGPSHFGLIGTKYLGVFLGHDGLPRLTGFFDDPNYFGLSMWGLIFIVVLMSQTYKFRKLTFVYLFIGVVDIVLTLSRMALLTGVLFIFLSVLSNKKNIRYLAMLIPLVIFVFFVPLSNSDIQDLILSRFSGNNDGSLDERTILLRTGLKSFYLHPFGVGIGNQQDYYLIEYGQAKLSHNDWISVMIECGILGVISYMMIFIVLFVLSKNKLSKICIICFVFILCTLTSYTYLAIIPIFVIFISYLSYILPKRERYAPSI